MQFSRLMSNVLSLPTLNRSTQSDGTQPRFCAYAPLARLLSIGPHNCANLPGVAVPVSREVYRTARYDAKGGVAPLHAVGSAIVGLSGLACPVAVFYTRLGRAPFLFAFNATDPSVRSLMKMNMRSRSFPIALMNPDESLFAEPILAVAPDIPVFDLALEETSDAGIIGTQAYIASAPIALAVVARRIGCCDGDAPQESATWICLTAEQYLLV